MIKFLSTSNSISTSSTNSAIWQTVSRLRSSSTTSTRMLRKRRYLLQNNMYHIMSEIHNFHDVHCSRDDCYLRKKEKTDERDSLKQHLNNRNKVAKAAATKFIDTNTQFRLNETYVFLHQQKALENASIIEYIQDDQVSSWILYDYVTWLIDTFHEIAAVLVMESNYMMEYNIEFNDDWLSSYDTLPRHCRIIQQTQWAVITMH